MLTTFYQSLRDRLYHWLTDEPPAEEAMPYDFNRLKHEIKPGDVLLIEGRSHVSNIIRSITQSPWTHAALYIGRLVDMEDADIQTMLRAQKDIKEDVRLIFEDCLDKGAILSPLSSYKHHHIRICRPIGITHTDIEAVLKYALKTLGQPYNVRHLLDLARFLLPWRILPRRWGSTLFYTSSGEPEGEICSSLIANAFTAVQFPILPFMQPEQDRVKELYHRNPHLYAPKDFDYSPYFAIIKYPVFNPEEPLPYYRRLPWTKSGFLHHDEGVLAQPKKHKKRFKLFSKKHNLLPPNDSEHT